MTARLNVTVAVTMVLSVAAYGAPTAGAPLQVPMALPLHGFLGVAGEDVGWRVADAHVSPRFWGVGFGSAPAAECLQGARLQVGQAQPGEVNVIRGIRRVASAPILNGDPGVEIELCSSRAFPVRAEPPVLWIGPHRFTLSRYPDDGDTHVLLFTLSAAEFAQTISGEPVVVQYGLEAGDPADRWEFGPLDLTLLCE